MFDPVKPFSESRKTYEDADIIVLGIPLDATVSFRPGTRFAPSAIREISWHLEDYDYLMDRDILDTSFYDMGDLRLGVDLEDSLSRIESAIGAVIDDGKLPLCIGGEHLISLPIVRALHKRVLDLHVVVFDAHADVSDSYRGTERSHATVTKLMHEVLGNGKLFLLGTRSGSREDKQFLERGIETSVMWSGPKFMEKLRGKNVYVSIDVDILDPSIAMGVGTPELDGWSYGELCEAIRSISSLSRIIGGDVVEVCPPCDPAGITAMVGARLVRELIFSMRNRSLR